MLVVKKFHCLFASDLVCFIDKIIKSTNEKESREDSDSSSCSTEISDDEVEDVHNLDDYDDKIEEVEKMISEEEIAAMEIDALSRSK